MPQIVDFPKVNRMKETEAIIERVKAINKHYQHLELAVDPALSNLKPGQSVLAWLMRGWDPYLREHWWPVNVASNKLVVERPANQIYEPGQLVNLLGVVGQPYRFRRSLRNVLLVAYDTPLTPLAMMIPWLLAHKIGVTVVLLGTALDYDTQHLPAEVEVIRGDPELNWSNRVMTLGWADQVFVIVGRDDEMQRFSNIWTLFNELRADIPKNYLFGVFQSPLPCGVGACHACMVRMQQGMKLACTEGPAFDLTTVMLTGAM